MEYTSERVSPGQYQATVEDRLIYLLHEKTYRFAAERVKDKYVLDFGCGDGYGTRILAEQSKKTIGVDLDGPAITQAQQKYSYPALSFAQMKPGRRPLLPFETGSFDAVVSFQVIEHVANVPDYLDEIRRLLRKGGSLLLSTPNSESRLLSFQNPWNKHHLREFTPLQLTQSVEPYFDIEHTFGLTYTPQWLEIEAKRVTRNKWLLWPLTNKLVPTPLRRHLLEAVWKIAVGRKRPTPLVGVQVPGIEDVLVTSDDIAACPSLLLVGRKKG